MNNKDPLLTILANSRSHIEKAINKSKYKNHLQSLPKINEQYEFFARASKSYNVVNPDLLPPLPENLREVQSGVIYKRGTHILCATAVTPESFKYEALYTAGLINHSCIKEDMSGVYISILKLSGDNIHYEPLAFSFLVRDDFFSSSSDRFILPFLILDETIPQPLIFQWVFLALQYLSVNLQTGIEYKHIASEKAEIDLLKSWGLY